MRAIFGVVSLLIVVAIVGLLASRQLKAVNTSVSSAAAQMVPAGASAPGAAAAPTGTVRQQSQQLQQQVVNEMTKALEQGARKDESDK